MKLAIMAALMLLVATQAWGACAWVLWALASKIADVPKELRGRDQEAQQTFREWGLVKAEKTKEECETTALAVLGKRYGTKAGRAAIDEGRLEIGPMWAKEVTPDGVLNLVPLAPARRKG